MSIRSILKKLQKLFAVKYIFNSKGILSNNTEHKKTFIILKRVRVLADRRLYVKNKTTFLSGNKCSFGLTTRRGNVLGVFEPNSEVYYKDLFSTIYFVSVTLPPHTSIKFENTFKNLSDEKVEKISEKKYNGKILLIAPGYPSVGNEYAFGFVHTRMKAYKELGLEVDVAIVNELYVHKSAYYEFEGVNVNCIGFNNLRILLQNHSYQKILVHFFLASYAQVLEAVDISDSTVYIYSHGVDTMYWDYPTITRPYFEPKKTYLDQARYDEFKIKDGIIERFNQRKNIHWVFNTEYALKNSQKLTGIKYQNVSIIPSPVDEKEFYFKERSPEDRKKICVIRTFNNLSTYSIDLSVRIILALSKKPYFSELSFDIYGDGDLHDQLVAPLREFENVHIHQHFLTHHEMADMYREHGIALFPTRYDTQGVSACEAAMTGAVVVTSDGQIGTKECIDQKLGTYCQTEDIDSYVQVIDGLINDENRFLKLSKKMHESVLNSCSSKYSFDKDIELIKAKPEKVDLVPKFTKKKEPILTIAIPSYNVEKYLKNSVYSLICHDKADQLEILIVNDGSKDKTAEIGKKLEKLTKTSNGSIVKLIDKENGGHGSTINAAIAVATGKYFKLMDGDDCFDTKNLGELINLLEKEDSDIVLTDFYEDLAIDGVKRAVKYYKFMEPGVKYDLDFMQYAGYGFSEWGPLLPTTTCKTQILKEANFKIDENCFYVDMEYNFIIYANAKTVTYYPLTIYSYYLGRAGQSMSVESRTRNILHHEKVCLRLLDEYEKLKSHLSEGKKQYLINRIIVPLCDSQYYVSLYFFKESKYFLSFDKKFKNYPEFYNHPKIVGKQIRLHRLTRGFTTRFNRLFDKLFRQNSQS